MIPRAVDYPPIWLAFFACVAWATGVGAGWNALAQGVGAALILAGLVITALAALEFRRHRTTIIPHQDADVLLTTGIFAWSRNPIYLADIGMLAGVVLWVGSLTGILLLPLFKLVLLHRFIKPEETRLKLKFGDAFDAYTTQTRRWI